MRQKLCVIGEALIDFIPQEKGRRLKDVASFERVAGGAPANAAGACVKLGGSAELITQLGEDAFGDYIVDCCKACGIDTTYILRTKDADTALAFVSLAADGNRDFQFYRRNCADLMLQSDDIHADMLKDCGALHFCSVSLVESPMKHAHEKLIRLARENDVLISFDVNLRLSLWEDHEALKQTVWQFIPQADIIKLSDEELTFLTGKQRIEDALPQLFCGNVKLIIYTMGKDGACAFTKSMRYAVDGIAVEAKDTTGAGDAFIGAFLYCLLKDGIDDLLLLREDQMREYLYFANAYGASVVTKAGALDAMMDKAEFACFLRQLNQGEGDGKTIGAQSAQMRHRID